MEQLISRGGNAAVSFAVRKIERVYGMTCVSKLIRKDLLMRGMVVMYSCKCSVGVGLISACCFVEFENQILCSFLSSIQSTSVIQAV